MKHISLPITMLFFLSCAEIKKEKAESYDAGFKTIQTVERSRIYRPGTGHNGLLALPASRIDIWYPAWSSATGSVLLFRDILGTPRNEGKLLYGVKCREWCNTTNSTIFYVRVSNVLTQLNC
jgi:hypothetical protein